MERLMQAQLDGHGAGLHTLEGMKPLKYIKILAGLAGRSCCSKHHCIRRGQVACRGENLRLSIPWQGLLYWIWKTANRKHGKKSS